MPYKRGYHWIFFVFVSMFGLWFGSQIFAQSSDSAGVYIERVRFSQILAAPVPALFYHFTLLFVGPHKNRLIRYSYLAGYAIASVRWGILLMNPWLLLANPRSTLTGWVVGTGPWDIYFNPFGIPIYATTMTILTLIVLSRYYIEKQSPFIRYQIKYVAASSLILIAAYYTYAWARYFGGIVTNHYPSSSTMLILLLAIRKHSFFSITPSVEQPSNTPVKYDLVQGASYLVIGPDQKYSFDIFSSLVLNGQMGLCITRLSPSYIGETYGLKSTPILWLTEEKGKDVIAPNDPNGLWLTVKAFTRLTDNPVLILHGIEYISS
ncbi:MAG TPA: DUF835 domain-containing protein, partial [Nitrososphaerales archaeon]